MGLPARFIQRTALHTRLAHPLSLRVRRLHIELGASHTQPPRRQAVVMLRLWQCRRRMGGMAIIRRVLSSVRRFAAHCSRRMVPASDRALSETVLVRVAHRLGGRAFLCCTFCLV